MKPPAPSDAAVAEPPPAPRADGGARAMLRGLLPTALLACTLGTFTAGWAALTWFDVREQTHAELQAELAAARGLLRQIVAALGSHARAAATADAAEPARDPALVAQHLAALRTGVPMAVEIDLVVGGRVLASSDGRADVEVAQAFDGQLDDRSAQAGLVIGSPYRRGWKQMLPVAWRAPVQAGQNRWLVVSGEVAPLIELLRELGLPDGATVVLLERAGRPWIQLPVGEAPTRALPPAFVARIPAESGDAGRFVHGGDADDPSPRFVAWVAPQASFDFWIAGAVPTSQATERWRKGYGLPVLATLVGTAILTAWLLSIAWRAQRAERQRALDALAVAQAEERLRMALDATADGLWEWDLDSDRVHFSDSFLKLLGQTRETIDASFTFRNTLHPEDADRTIAAVRHALAHGTPFDEEYRLRTREGAYRWFRGRGRLYRDPDGRPSKFSGILTDITDRRRITEQLRAREAQLRQIFESHVAVQIITDPKDGRIVDANQAACFFYGLSREALVGRSLWSISVTTPEEAREEMARARREGRRYFSFRHRLASGEVRDVEVYSGPLRTGSRTRIYSVIHDATDRRRAEAAVRDTLAQLESAGRIARLGYWRYDVAGERLQWSTITREIHEVDDLFVPDVQAGVSFYVPEHRAVVEESVRRCLSQGTPFDLELQIRTARGRLRWVRARGEPVVEDGRVIAMLGVFLDIDDRRRASDHLLRLTERLELATRAAGLGIWEWDVGTGRTIWNDRMYEIFGDTPEAHRADPRTPRDRLLSFVAEHDRERIAARIDRDEAGPDDAVEVEYDIRRASDGALRTVLSHGIVHRDASGRRTMVVGALQDITARKALVEAERARETAELASQAKSQFLSRMSHELRTPLNAVLGFAQLLEKDVVQPLSARQREQIGHIQRAGWHLLSMINDMLDLSRIEAGRLSVVPEDVALSPLVADCLPLVLPAARDAGVALVDRVDDDALAVRADPRRLRQVLFNLLSNGVKYNHRGGSVTVRAWRDGPMVALEVADTGIGMSAHALEQLFQPFERLGAERTSVEGTGIGLVITRGLVDLMGGRIDVDSAPQAGSRFVVRLPVATVPVPALPMPQAVPMAAPGERARAAAVRRVLYVEDNASNVRLVAETLAMSDGWQLEVARDGASGIALGTASPPDLILIDINLPDMDGLAVLRALRADPRTSGVPCVALSADALPQEVERALRAGFVDYWTKPIDVLTFADRLDGVLALNPSAA